MRALVLSIALLGCRSTAHTAEPPQPQERACADFYDVACGDWLRNHPVPPDRSRWMLYDEITQRNRARVREILESARKVPGDPVGDYFTACLDESRIAKAELAPMRTDLARIDKIARPEDVVATFAEFAKSGVELPFEIWPAPDVDDPTRLIVEADVSGLGLRALDDYSHDDKVADYAAHIARVLQVLGAVTSVDEQRARRVVLFERDLAMARRPERDRDDPRTLHHPVARDRAAGWSWPKFLAMLGAPPDAPVNETEPAYFAALAKHVESTDPAIWRDYLRVRLIHSMRHALPPTLATLEFEFYERKLHGVKEPRPRWDRCADLVDRDLGDLVAQRFVARAFTPRDRERVRGIVERVRAALHDEVAAATWMTESTRAAAVAKLAALRVQIGYPEHWREYTALRIDSHDAYGNAQRAQAHELARQMAQLGKPVDLDEWFALPQTLAGYSTPRRNQVTFSAGFLQPPIYDPAADDATTFGALGAVIGHEITHLFDVEGRHFDRTGRMRDWWTTADAAAYDERAACFVEQYSKYPEAGSFVDGKLTASENIADNGGLRVAHRAAHLPDRTAERRFFEAWAHIRCTAITPERARELLKTDGHSPGRYRVDGVVSNMPEFGEAFGCRAPAPMVRTPPCKLW